MLVILPGEALNNYPRGKTPITQIVLHESVTSSREATVKVLRGRSLGVHYIVDRDGSVTQHAPIDKACAHAEGFGKASLHNEASIAVEVVNRYYGGRPEARGYERINAVWAHKGVYVVPSPTQLESVWQLVHVLCAQHKIPLVFPGVQRVLKLGPQRFVWGRIAKHEVPGIMAHARWAHADALFVEHYCLARHLGCEPEDAFAQTCVAGASGSRKTKLPAPSVALARAA